MLRLSQHTSSCNRRGQLPGALACVELAATHGAQHQHLRRRLYNIKSYGMLYYIIFVLWHTYIRSYYMLAITSYYIMPLRARCRTCSETRRRSSGCRSRRRPAPRHTPSIIIIMFIIIIIITSTIIIVVINICAAISIHTVIIIIIAILFVIIIIMTIVINLPVALLVRLPSQVPHHAPDGLLPPLGPDGGGVVLLFDTIKLLLLLLVPLLCTIYYLLLLLYY